MLETRFGTEDGYIMRQYSKGKSYELADNLARYFLRSGFARTA